MSTVLVYYRCFSITEKTIYCDNVLFDNFFFLQRQRRALLNYQKSRFISERVTYLKEKNFLPTYNFVFELTVYSVSQHFVI